MQSTDNTGKKTVLLVEDDELVRSASVRMLQYLGYRVVTAKDGMEALEVYGDEADLALILLDLTMPRMSGIECLRALRDRGCLAPILVCTGSADLTELAGASGVLHKPFGLDKLREALGDLVGDRFL